MPDRDDFRYARSSEYREDGYIRAVEGSTVWDYRRDARVVGWYQLDEIWITQDRVLFGIQTDFEPGTYPSLKTALHEALTEGDYSVLDSAIRMFRTYLLDLSEESPVRLDDSSLPPTDPPAKWIMNYAFPAGLFPGRTVAPGPWGGNYVEKFSSFKVDELKERIGSVWLHTLGPLAIDNEPDLIVMPTSEPFSADDPPEPGEVALRWGDDGDGNSIHSWSELTDDPEGLASEIELTAYGSVIRYRPITNDACGGSFLEWITYLIFPSAIIYDPFPETAFEYLAPTVRRVLDIPDRPFVATINRHFA